MGKEKLVEQASVVAREEARRLVEEGAKPRLHEVLHPGRQPAREVAGRKAEELVSVARTATVGLLKEAGEELRRAIDPHYTKQINDDTRKMHAAAGRVKNAAVRSVVLFALKRSEDFFADGRLEAYNAAMHVAATLIKASQVNDKKAAEQFAARAKKIIEAGEGQNAAPFKQAARRLRTDAWLVAVTADNQALHALSRSPNFTKSERQFFSGTAKKVQGLVEQARAAENERHAAVALAAATGMFKSATIFASLPYALRSPKAAKAQEAVELLHKSAAEKPDMAVFSRGMAAVGALSLWEGNYTGRLRMLYDLNKANADNRRAFGSTYNAYSAIQGQLKDAFVHARKGEFAKADGIMAGAMERIKKEGAAAQRTGAARRFQEEARRLEGEAAAIRKQAELVIYKRARSEILPAQHLQRLAEGYTLVALKYKQLARAAQEGKLKKENPDVQAARQATYVLTAVRNSFGLAHAIEKEYFAAEKSTLPFIHEDKGAKALFAAYSAYRREKAKPLVDAAHERLLQLVGGEAGTARLKNDQKNIAALIRGAEGLAHSASTLQYSFLREQTGFRLSQQMLQMKEKYLNIAMQMKRKDYSAGDVRIVLDAAAYFERQSEQAAKDPAGYAAGFVSTRDEMRKHVERAWDALGRVAGGGATRLGVWRSMALSDMNLLHMVAFPLPSTGKAGALGKAMLEQSWEVLSRAQCYAISVAIEGKLVSESEQLAALRALEGVAANVSYMYAAVATDRHAEAQKYENAAFSDMMKFTSSQTSMRVVNAYAEGAGQLGKVFTGFFFPQIIIADLLHDVGMNWSKYDAAEKGVKLAMAALMLVPAAGSFGRYEQMLNQLGQGRMLATGRAVHAIDAALVDMQVGTYMQITGKYFTSAENAALRTGLIRQIAQVTRAEAAGAEAAGGAVIEGTAAAGARFEAGIEAANVIAGVGLDTLGIADVVLALKRNNWKFTDDLALQLVQEGTFGAMGTGTLMLAGLKRLRTGRVRMSAMQPGVDGFLINTERRLAGMPEPEVVMAGKREAIAASGIGRREGELAGPSLRRFEEASGTRAGKANARKQEVKEVVIELEAEPRQKPAPVAGKVKEALTPTESSMVDLLRKADGYDSHVDATQSYTFVADAIKTLEQHGAKHVTVSRFEDCCAIYLELKRTSGKDLLWNLATYLNGYAAHLEKGRAVSFRKYMESKVFAPLKGREKRFREIAVKGEGYGEVLSAYGNALLAMREAGVESPMRTRGFTLDNCLKIYAQLRSFSQRKGAAGMVRKAGERRLSAYLSDYTAAVRNGYNGTFDNYLLSAVVKPRVRDYVKAGAKGFVEGFTGKLAEGGMRSDATGGVYSYMESIVSGIVQAARRIRNVREEARQAKPPGRYTGTHAFTVQEQAYVRERGLEPIIAEVEYDTLRREQGYAGSIENYVGIKKASQKFGGNEDVAMDVIVTRYNGNVTQFTLESNALSRMIATKFSGVPSGELALHLLSSGLESSRLAIIVRTSTDVSTLARELERMAGIRRPAAGTPQPAVRQQPAAGRQQRVEAQDYRQLIEVAAISKDYETWITSHFSQSAVQPSRAAVDNALILAGDRAGSRKNVFGSFADTAGSESIGGNAGAGSGINGYYDPATGRIIAFGNVQHIPPEIRATGKPFSLRIALSDGRLQVIDGTDVHALAALEGMKVAKSYREMIAEAKSYKRVSAVARSATQDTKPAAPEVKHKEPEAAQPAPKPPEPVAIPLAAEGRLEELYTQNAQQLRELSAKIQQTTDAQDIRALQRKGKRLNDGRDALLKLMEARDKGTGENFASLEREWSMREKAVAGAIEAKPKPAAATQAELTRLETELRNAHHELRSTDGLSADSGVRKARVEDYEKALRALARKSDKKLWEIEKAALGEEAIEAKPELGISKAQKPGVGLQELRRLATPELPKLFQFENVAIHGLEQHLPPRTDGRSASIRYLARELHQCVATGREPLPYYKEAVGRLRKTPAPENFVREATALIDDVQLAAKTTEAVKVIDSRAASGTKTPVAVAGSFEAQGAKPKAQDTGSKTGSAKTPAEFRQGDIIQLTQSDAAHRTLIKGEERLLFHAETVEGAMKKYGYTREEAETAVNGLRKLLGPPVMVNGIAYNVALPRHARQFTSENILKVHVGENGRLSVVKYLPART